MKKRICDLASCGKEYEYKLDTSRFCSGKCRAKHSSLNGPAQPTQSTTPIAEERPSRSRASFPTDGTVISPQAQYMINHSEREADRWEKLYDKEKLKLEATQKDLAKAEKALVELKMEQRIADSTEPEAPGLGNVLMEKLSDPAYAQFIGPLIQQGGQAFIDFMKRGPSQNQIAGASDSTVATFESWMGTLSEGVRDQVTALLKYLSSLDEISVARTIAQLQQMTGAMYARTA